MIAVLAKISAAGVELPDQRLYSKATLARALDCSTRTIERRLATGDFPPPDIADGNFIRWRRETIDKWIAQQVENSRSHGGA